LLSLRTASKSPAVHAAGFRRAARWRLEWPPSPAGRNRNDRSDPLPQSALLEIARRARAASGARHAAHRRALSGKLGLSARQLLRTGEEEYQSLGLADTALTDAQIIAAMARHPRLIERPILIAGDKAVIGRPPEKVLELLA